MPILLNKNNVSRFFSRAGLAQLVQYQWVRGLKKGKKAKGENMAKYLTIEQFEGCDDSIVKYLDEDTVKENDNNMVVVGSKEHILNLQLVMATSSVNHEYARLEYNETNNTDKKDELLQYMADCRFKYEEAREELSCVNPLVLETFEKDLVMQKQSTMVHYHA